MTDQTMEDSGANDVIEKDIIELLGLTNLPKEKQDEYRQKASETIYDRAFTRITKLLEEKGKLPEFEKVAQDEVKMKEFLFQNGIELEKLMTEETLIYKAQMKTVAEVLDTGISVATKSE